MTATIEAAIHLLKQALQLATTNTTAAGAAVQAAIAQLSPLTAAQGLGPDDDVNTKSS